MTKQQQNTLAAAAVLSALLIAAAVAWAGLARDNGRTAPNAQQSKGDVVLDDIDATSENLDVYDTPVVEPEPTGQDGPVEPRPTIDPYEGPMVRAQEKLYLDGEVFHVSVTTQGAMSFYDFSLPNKSPLIN